jgi:hypothetical protein
VGVNADLPAVTLAITDGGFSLAVLSSCCILTWGTRLEFNPTIDLVTEQEISRRQ